MDIQQQKAQAFIRRLLSHPTLSNLQTLQKEDQIYQFIISNRESLFSTLSSIQFFPGKRWEQIVSILCDALSTVVGELLSSEISAILSTIDFSFIAFFTQLNYPVSKCRDQIYEFLVKLLVKAQARKAFEGPFTSIKIGMTDRYLDNVFIRNEYIQFELFKVQKLKMGKEEIKNLLKISLMLKSGIHVLTDGDTSGDTEIVSDTIRRSFAEKANTALRSHLKLLPPELIKSAVDSNLSFMENPNMETTARIGAVFSARCRNYKHIAGVERGAERPDKSWFSIARRNFRHHGFDIKMLDEFYRIATENGW